MKEIKDYLHLYLGCDCVVDGNKYFSGTPKNYDLKAIPATFDSINRNRNIRIEQWVGVTFKCGERGFEYYNCFNELCNCYTHFIHPDKIKPILRPLSSMTEEEMKEIWQLVFKSKFPESGLIMYKDRGQSSERYVLMSGVERVGICLYGDVWADSDLSGYKFNVFNTFHYLLSKHFDLFGLIEAGLAIDATKTPST